MRTFHLIEFRKQLKLFKNVFICTKVWISFFYIGFFYKGSLNKVLMDDKGSTLLVVFGLPPMSHQDDAVRGILTGFLLIDEL